MSTPLPPPPLSLKLFCQQHLGVWSSPEATTAFTHYIIALSYIEVNHVNLEALDWKQLAVPCAERADPHWSYCCRWSSLFLKFIRFIHRQHPHDGGVESHPSPSSDSFLISSTDCSCGCVAVNIVKCYSGIRWGKHHWTELTPSLWYLTWLFWSKNNRLYVRSLALHYNWKSRRAQCNGKAIRGGAVGWGSQFDTTYIVIMVCWSAHVAHWAVNQWI